MCWSLCEDRAKEETWAGTEIRLEPFGQEISESQATCIISSIKGSGPYGHICLNPTISSLQEAEQSEVP